MKRLFCLMLAVAMLMSSVCSSGSTYDYKWEASIR